MSEDDIEVVEEAWGGKSEMSIKEIILRHLRKISDISSQELTPSRWEKRPIKIGEGVSILEKYHPDLREAYINSIDFLLDMVSPYKDQEGEEKTFKEALTKLKESEKNKFKTVNKNKSNQNLWIDQKLKLRRKLFAEIMLFLNRIDFFTSQVYGE